MPDTGFSSVPSTPSIYFREGTFSRRVFREEGVAASQNHLKF